MDHLIQPIPEVERITGRREPIVAAYTEGGRSLYSLMFHPR